MVVWPLAALAFATIAAHSWSTCAWVLPCSSHHLVRFSYQSLSDTSTVILPRYLGSARSSQLRGSSPGLIRLVFHAGRNRLNRVAVQCGNLPVSFTRFSAAPV